MGSATILIVSFVAMYILFCYPMYVMGQKIGSPNAWWAFVPILNAFLLLEIAGKEWWWFLLFLIPCANIVAFVLVWMAVAERMGKPSWVGCLLLVPYVGWFTPFYIAFG